MDEYSLMIESYYHFLWKSEQNQVFIVQTDVNFDPFFPFEITQWKILIWKLDQVFCFIREKYKFQVSIIGVFFFISFGIYSVAFFAINTLFVTLVCLLASMQVLFEARTLLCLRILGYCLNIYVGFSHVFKMSLTVNTCSKYGENKYIIIWCSRAMCYLLLLIIDLLAFALKTMAALCYFDME